MCLFCFSGGGGHAEKEGGRERQGEDELNRFEPMFMVPESVLFPLLQESIFC